MITLDNMLIERYQTNWNQLFDDYSSGNEDAVNFINNAAIEIVEYEGFLRDSSNTVETKQQRDARMEDNIVYQGDISKLVSYLKDFDDGLKSLTKVEIIFKIYNRIHPVENIPNRTVVEGEVEAHTEEPTSEIGNASTGSTASTAKAAEVDEQELAIPNQSSGNYSEEKPEVDYKEPQDTIAETNGEVSGQLNIETGSSEPKQINSSMEDKNMAGLDALNTMAQQAQGAGIASKPEEVSNEFKDAAVAAIKNSMGERIAWTNSHIVAKAVTSAEPLVKRIPDGSKGVLSNSGAGAKRIAKIKKDFAKVTGWKPEDPDNRDFFETVHEEDREKASKVLDLILAMEAQPEAEYDIFLPKPAYAIKGVQIGADTPVPNEVFTDILLNNSIGFAVTAAGIVNGAATKGSQNGTTFELVTSKTTKKSKKEGEVSSNDAAKESVVYKRNVRVSGKSNLTDDSSNILIVYPTNRAVGKDGMKPVKVKALIALNSGEAAASFRYKNGTKQKVVKENGQDVTKNVDKYSTFSLSLVTLAYITEEQPSEAFKTIDAATLEKFGKAISLKSGRTTEKEIVSTDNQDVLEKYLEKSGIVKALQLAAGGHFSDTTGINDIVNSVKAAGENAAAQANANAAASVEEDMA